MTELDTTDRAVLDRLQAGLPLSPAPFAELGQALDLDGTEVLTRVRRLKEAGVIRFLGAILDTRRLGYESTLAAFHMPQGVLERVAARVNAHPGVSHNYERPHYYNLWFTLAVPPGQTVGAELETLAGEAGVDDWLNLPALRVFKIKTQFHLEGGGVPPLPARHEPAGPPAQASRPLRPADIPLVQALQEDLPLEERPFASLARRLDLDEVELLARAQELVEAGFVRRFSALLRHREVGYTANGMACWAVPEARIEVAGRAAAAHPRVSHCYQRPAFPPRWPYTLFTMIHGRSPSEVEDAVAEIARETGPAPHEVLYSTREFKKERIKYFT